MFNDPQSFFSLIEECCCICFTATPDNCDPHGCEAKIVHALGFQQFNYVLGQYQQNDEDAKLQITDVVNANTDAENALYVKQCLLTGPVLVFGTAALTEQLKSAGYEPLVISDNVEVDDNLFRCLDVPPYRVIMSESQVGMRGIDHRCQKSQMTLVVAQSFESKRESIQGMARVGRFGDSCKRVIFADVQLVDNSAELIYTAKLFQLLSQLEKKPIKMKQVQTKAPSTRGGTTHGFGHGSKMTQDRLNTLFLQHKNIPGGR